jgi:hypothetical protein
MTAYYAGGVPYRVAARWTYGELLAVYRGRHWSGGKPTRKPDIPAAEALKRAEAALREIKEVYTGAAKGKGTVKDFKKVLIP